MILKHNKYPKVAVRLPNGGRIEFNNYTALVLPQTLKLFGIEYFEALLSSGKVELVGEKPLISYFEEVENLDVDNAEIVLTPEEKEEAANEKKKTKKRSGAKKGSKKK